MEKKIVFFDIDGTLFDNEANIIHESTLEALKKLHAREDVYVCLATGRSSEQAMEIIDRYALLFDGYVLINGQYVILNNEVIFKNPLPKTFVRRYIDECNRLGLPFGLISNSLSMVSSYHPLVVESYRKFKMNLPKIAEELDYDNDFYQGLFFAMDYLEHFHIMFKEEVEFYVWMLNDGADIVPIGSSKAVGMEKIRQALNVKRENIYALGDSSNDIEMLKYAHVGIAMGNAKEEVKKVSDYVTDDIKKDGLAKALKKYHLI